jgi:hypothetical protein
MGAAIRNRRSVSKHFRAVHPDMGVCGLRSISVDMRILWRPVPRGPIIRTSGICCIHILEPTGVNVRTRGIHVAGSSILWLRGVRRWSP